MLTGIYRLCLSTFTYVLYNTSSSKSSLWRCGGVQLFEKTAEATRSDFSTLWHLRQGGYRKSWDRQGGDPRWPPWGFVLRGGEIHEIHIRWEIGRDIWMIQMDRMFDIFHHWVLRFQRIWDTVLIWCYRVGSNLKKTCMYIDLATTLERGPSQIDHMRFDFYKVLQSVPRSWCNFSCICSQSCRKLQYGMSKVVKCGSQLRHPRIQI